MYAGPRDDAFFVDLGSIFDLAGLRPFNGAHLLPLEPASGVDGVAGFDTNTIALKVPIAELRQSAEPAGHRGLGEREPTGGPGPREGRHAQPTSGPGSRSRGWAIPLINEVIIPRHLKDYWNASKPKDDKQFKKYYEIPSSPASSICSTRASRTWRPPGAPTSR